MALTELRMTGEPDRIGAGRRCVILEPCSVTAEE